VSVLLAFAAALAALPCAAYWVPAPPPPGALVKEYDAEKVKRIDLRADAGLVRLEPVTGPLLTAIVVRRDAGTCRVEAFFREGRLTLSVVEKAPASPLGGAGRCPAELTLRLPRAVELSAATGSAPIEGEALKGPVRLRTGSGSVRLLWETAPRGLVEVETGSGRVELVFPSGTRADASLASGSGAVFDELTPDRRAKLRVRVRSGSGDVVMR
jgi:hypothetical protein